MLLLLLLLLLCARVPLNLLQIPTEFSEGWVGGVSDFTLNCDKAKTTVCMCARVGFCLARSVFEHEHKHKFHHEDFSLCL
jgi:hypothetical protein